MACALSVGCEVYACTCAAYGGVGLAVGGLGVGARVEAGGHVAGVAVREGC